MKIKSLVSAMALLAFGFSVSSVYADPCRDCLKNKTKAQCEATHHCPSTQHINPAQPR